MLAGIFCFLLSTQLQDVQVELLVLLLALDSLWVSLPCSPASYLLFPTSCASLVWIHLGAGFVSKLHAQDHRVGSVYTLSRTTLTHQPHRTILKWTQSIPRQTPHVLFTQPALLQHRKGSQHYKPPAQELEFGHSQAEFWSTATPMLKNSNQGKAIRELGRSKLAPITILSLIL